MEKEKEKEFKWIDYMTYLLEQKRYQHLTLNSDEYYLTPEQKREKYLKSCRVK